MNGTQWIFCAVTALYWFSLYAYVPILPVYAASLGASYKLIGLIVGSYGITQFILRIPQGLLSDHLRKRKIFVIIAMLISVVSSVGMLMFPDAMALLFFRGLSGVAATVWVIMVILFASYFSPAEAPKAYGIMNSASFTGQVIAMFAGGLIAQSWGWSSTFVLAAAGAGLGLLFSLFIQENVPKAGEPLRLTQVPEIVRNKHVLLSSILAILVQILVYGTVFGFVPLAAQNIGATNFEIGVLTMLASLPSIVSSLLAGTWFIERFGRRMTLCAGFLLLTLSAVVVPFLDSMFQLYISQLIGGFGRGMIFPLLMALSVKSVEDKVKATAMGVFQSLYAMGMFIGPVMVGVISDIAGMNQGFWLCGLMGIFGVVIAARFVGE
jgi:MFS family permease